MPKIIAAVLVLLLAAGGLAWFSWAPSVPEWREPERIACYSPTPNQDEVTRQCRAYLGIPATGPDPNQSRTVQVRQRIAQLECALECSRIGIAGRTSAQPAR